MCLNTLTKTYAKPDPKVRKAWKLVEITFDGRIRTPYFTTTLEKGKWNTACGNALYTEDYNSFSGFRYFREGYYDRRRYAAGFHVFATRAEGRLAQKLLWPTCSSRRLVPVEVKGIVAEGTDGTSASREYVEANIRTLVALKLRLL